MTQLNDNFNKKFKGSLTIHIQFDAIANSEQAFEGELLEIGLEYTRQLVGVLDNGDGNWTASHHILQAWGKQPYTSLKEVVDKASLEMQLAEMKAELTKLEGLVKTYSGD